MNEEERKKYYQIFTTYWRIFREYSKPNDSDEYWRALIDEVSGAHDALQDIDDELSREIGVATMQALQRYYKRMKEKG